MVDIIPTLIIRDKDTLTSLLSGQDFDPWLLQEFTTQQVSIIMGQGLHGSAITVLKWLEEALVGVCGSHLGSWAVHVWGLPPSSAEKIQTSWLSRHNNKSFSICAHAESPPSLPRDNFLTLEDPQMADILRRAPHITAGLEKTLGPVFQLRR